MTTVMIVHSTCGSRVYIGMYIQSFMIAWLVNVVFMARRAIPMIAFHWVESTYIYFFSCVHLCKYEKLHHSQQKES